MSLFLITKPFVPIHGFTPIGEFGAHEYAKGSTYLTPCSGVNNSKQKLGKKNERLIDLFSAVTLLREKEFDNVELCFLFEADGRLSEDTFSEFCKHQKREPIDKANLVLALKTVYINA
jgi:hypothetical protein